MATPQEKIDQVFTQHPTVRFRKREIIFRAEDIPSGVFQIKTGYVRLYSLASSGEELTMLILKPYDFFPTRWAIGDLPMKHVLEAMTDVVAWKIPKGQFLSTIRADNEILYEFTHRMVVRISSLYDRMNQLVFGTSTTKIAAILVMCRQAYGVSTEEGTPIDPPLTHHEIANLVGVTRETASIEIKHLEREGIIAIKEHRIYITDLDRLKSLVK